MGKFGFPVLLGELKNRGLFHVHEHHILFIRKSAVQTKIFNAGAEVAEGTLRRVCV
jgi:ABC-type uncharacterized transport system ATPase subunit